jgi:hypothetical protein
MNVELTFTPDDLELRDVGPGTDEVLLFETTLVVQVGFRVGDRELLAIERAPAAPQPIVGPEGSASWVAAAPIPAPGAPQPVIGFLCKTRDAIRRAADGEASMASLAFGWPSLHFDPSGNGLVAVRLGRGGAPATAEARDFEAAALSFRDSVHAWIAETAPLMQQHPGWSRWFGDEHS